MVEGVIIAIAVFAVEITTTTVAVVKGKIFIIVIITKSERRNRFSALPDHCFRITAVYCWRRRRLLI